MTKEIKGNIEYTLNISENGEWTITYGSHLEDEKQILHNDMASLAMAQNVMEICAVRIREEKNASKGRSRKFLGEKLNKVIDGRFGVKIICDYMLDSYEPYMQYLAEKEANSALLSDGDQPLVNKSDIVNKKPIIIEQLPMTEEDIKLGMEAANKIAKEKYNK